MGKDRWHPEDQFTNDVALGLSVATADVKDGGQDPSGVLCAFYLQ